MQNFELLTEGNGGLAHSFICRAISPSGEKREAKGEMDSSASSLMLIPIAGNLVPLTTAVLYAKEARAYLKISTAGFNELIKHRIITRYTHIGGRRPFFLKHELDAYLSSLPRYMMDDCETSPSSEKGSSV